MPLSPIPPSTKDVLKRISECQILLNEIYNNLSHTQGYCLSIPPTTIETWRTTTDRLNCLSYRWEIALQNKKRHPTNMFCNKESKATVNTLLETLKRAQYQQVCAAENEDNEQKGAKKRRAMLDRLAEAHPYHWETAFDVEAYRAVYSLHQYSMTRAWTTDVEFGDGWSEQELEERERLSKKHLKEVFGKIHKT